MKNHLLNIGILAVLIFIGSPGCKPSPSPLILTEQSHAELTPYADTRIDTLNHIIENSFLREDRPELYSRASGI